MPLSFRIGCGLNRAPSVHEACALWRGAARLCPTRLSSATKPESKVLRVRESQRGHVGRELVDAVFHDGPNVLCGRTAAMAAGGYAHSALRLRRCSRVERCRKACAGAGACAPLPYARGFPDHRGAGNRAAAGCRRWCRWPSLSMIAGPWPSLSKTISIMRSRPRRAHPSEAARVPCMRSSAALSGIWSNCAIIFRVVEPVPGIRCCSPHASFTVRLTNR